MRRAFDLAKYGWAKYAIVAIVLIAAGFELVWGFATLSSRPIDGVEGEVLFEASRIRAKLPLYIDPTVGAHDYGPIPARFMVLYPPLWAFVLSFVPDSARLEVGRLAGFTASLFVLGWIVVRAAREQQRVAIVWAAFIVAAHPLMLYAASARPDAPALLLSGLSLERAVRKRGLDSISSALLVLAAWVKPNFIGLLPGAFFGTLYLAYRTPLARRPLALAIGAALSTAIFIAVALHMVSGGLWINHFLASTGQPPNIDLWLSQLALRLPFFGAPLLLALVIGYSGRKDAGTLIATCALGTSCAWTLLSLAKIGSASNYFLEPCVAALIVYARAPLPFVLTPRYKIAGFVFAAIQALWVSVAGIRSSVDEILSSPLRARAINDARDVCNAAPNDVVIADEPGLELMMNGRITATPFQFTHLARRGRLSTASWREDLKRSEITCLVMQDDLLERPLHEISLAHDRFDSELRQLLHQRFELRITRAGYWFYGVHREYQNRED